MVLTVRGGIGCGVSGKTKNAASPQSIEKLDSSYAKDAFNDNYYVYQATPYDVDAIGSKN